VRLEIPIHRQRRHDWADELRTMRHLFIEAEAAYRRSEGDPYKFIGRKKAP